MPIIEIKNLSKEFKTLEKGEGFLGAIKGLFSRKYKIKKALINVSLKIEKGEFVGIIGPNGAGKSTLIKILTGILTPSSGEAKVLDLVPYEYRKENAKNIGVVFGQRTQLWWDLPVKDSFELMKALYEIPDNIYNKNIRTFSKVLGIDKYMHQSVRKLSLGERMRCDLAASLLHNPPIVYLDEPTIGLDVEAKHRMREFLKEVNKRGTTIILTTHDMGDIEELCPRIVIIDKGKILYDGPTEKIKTKFTNKRVIKINFFGAVPKSFVNLPGTKIINKSYDKLWIEVDMKKAKASDVVKKIFQRWKIDDISIEEPDIEDMIRKIYKSGV